MPSNHMSPRRLRKALEAMDCEGQPEVAAVRDWLLADLSLDLNENSRGAAAMAAAARAFFRKIRWR